MHAGVGTLEWGRRKDKTAVLASALAVTTGYRSVVSEVVRARFPVDPSRVFPGFAGAPLGVLAARTT